MITFEDEQILETLRENLYPTNYTCITGTLNIDKSWPEREEKAKKLRKLLGFPDRHFIN